jgi:branched-chain amino acid transport system ATP-binding protein
VTEVPAGPGLPIIAADRLHVHYGQSHILRGVSLAIRPGETIGLMGRNGMGKTTLVRALLGLVPVSGGTVRIDGEETKAWPTFRRVRAGIAYVPEGRGIFASLSVAENISIAARTGAGASTLWTTEGLLELFPRLQARLANRGDQLSGGEQQMLAICRGLASNPRLIILDEATEGLAPLIRDEIWRTIGLIRERGIATLIVDKTVTKVAAIADCIAILVKGEIAFEGTPTALLEAPEIMHRHLGV